MITNYLRKNFPLVYRVLPQARGEARLEKIADRLRTSNLYEKPCPKTTRRLIQLAKKWKASQKHLLFQELTSKEFTRLKKADKYPRFFQVLLASKPLRERFFEWLLRDNNLFDIFVFFPKIALNLIQSNLSGRIGVAKREALQLSSTYPKQLFLLVEGRLEPLDCLDRVITFEKGYRLSWKEIFTIFENKFYEGGNLEFMQEGIVNWNPLKLGVWNPHKSAWDRVDLNARDWFKSLPLFKTLSLTEVKARYQVNPKRHDWVVAAAATRESRNLDYNDTHAFLEIAIPDGKGQWNYFDFGKVAKKFPKNIFELLGMLVKLTPATIAYPDENIFYTFRQEGNLAFVISQEQGRALFDSIKIDLLKAQKDNFLYQVETENCAKWVYETLEKVIDPRNLSSFFWMPLLETEAGGFLGAVFRCIARLPKLWQIPAMKLGHLLAGSFQQTIISERGVLVAKSVMTHDFSTHGYVFLPALLVHKQESNLIKSILNRCRMAVKSVERWGSKAHVKIWLKNIRIGSLSVWLTCATLLENFAKLPEQGTKFISTSMATLNPYQNLELNSYRS